MRLHEGTSVCRYAQVGLHEGDAVLVREHIRKVRVQLLLHLTKGPSSVIPCAFLESCVRMLWKFLAAMVPEHLILGASDDTRRITHTQAG